MVVTLLLKAIGLPEDRNFAFSAKDENYTALLS